MNSMLKTLIKIQIVKRPIHWIYIPLLHIVFWLVHCSQFHHKKKSERVQKEQLFSKAKAIIEIMTNQTLAKLSWQHPWNINTTGLQTDKKPSKFC